MSILSSNVISHRGFPGNGESGKRGTPSSKYSEIVWLLASRIASTCTNASRLTGLPNTYTVEVLLRIYAHCIDGDDDRWFGPMEDALDRG